MADPKQQRERHRAFILAHISRSDLEKARAEAAMKGPLTYNELKYEALLDVIELDAYDLMIPKRDPSMDCFECLSPEQREEYVQKFGGQEGSGEQVSQEAFEFQCREIAGGAETHARLMSEYDLAFKESQSRAFGFFDMFSQGRSLGRLPQPKELLAFCRVMEKRISAAMDWLEVRTTEETTAVTPELPSAD